MKILVLSDSHGSDRNVRKAVRKEAPFDALIHLGDSQEEMELFRASSGCTAELYMVRGNCDFTGSYPELLTLELAGHRCFLTHGHYHYVSFGTGELCAEARENDCEIALYGHTHRPNLSDEGDVLVLNPGSISYPRQDGHNPSYMVLTLEEGKEPQVSLHYL